MTCHPSFGSHSQNPVCRRGLRLRFFVFHLSMADKPSSAQGLVCFVMQQVTPHKIGKGLTKMRVTPHFFTPHRTEPCQRERGLWDTRMSILKVGHRNVSQPPYDTIVSPTKLKVGLFYYETQKRRENQGIGNKPLTPEPTQTELPTQKHPIPPTMTWSQFYLAIIRRGIPERAAKPIASRQSGIATANPTTTTEPDVSPKPKMPKKKPSLEYWDFLTFDVSAKYSNTQSCDATICFKTQFPQKILPVHRNMESRCCYHHCRQVLSFVGQRNLTRSTRWRR
jgi:hypothetical protein